MTVRIIEAGPQATLQGAPRDTYRHFGIPASGPADPLSHAIALNVDTICLHGDTAGAVHSALALREALHARGIGIKAQLAL